MPLVGKRSLGRKRVGQRTRAGLGGRAAALKGIESELEADVVRETEDLAQTGMPGQPGDRDVAHMGGSRSRGGKHVVEDGWLSEEHGGIAVARVSGSLAGKRKQPQRSTRGRR